MLEEEEANMALTEEGKRRKFQYKYINRLKDIINDEDEAMDFRREARRIKNKRL